MQRINVNYSVSRTVALTEGRAEYGTATYQPSDTELQFLCATDRQYLDSHEHEVFHLPTAVPPTWPVIADAITAARLAAEVEAERTRVELTAKVDAALAAPDEAWFTGINLVVPGWGTLWNVPRAIREEARIVARLEALRSEAERRKAEADAASAADQARREAERAAKEAARESALESAVQWALASEDPALSRAARDGYEITNAVLQRVADTLAAQLGGKTSTEGTAHWRRWDFEERSAPSQVAFEAFDRAKAAIEQLDKPAGVSVELQRVARVTVEPADDDNYGEAEFFTAIVVMVSVPGTGCKDRAVIVKVDQ